LSSFVTFKDSSVTAVFFLFFSFFFVCLRLRRNLGIRNYSTGALTGILMEITFSVPDLKPELFLLKESNKFQARQECKG